MNDKGRKIRGDMTSMIDCVFLLLIFFVFAAKFVVPEGHLDVWMPKQGQGPGVAASAFEDTRIIIRGGGKQNITLYLDSFFFGEFDRNIRTWKQNKNLVAYENELEKVNSAFHSQHGLINKLKKLQQSGAVKKVVISAEPEVPYVFVIQAIDACGLAGVSDVEFKAAHQRLKSVGTGLITMNH